MDSWLSVPILYIFLLFSQLTFADSSYPGVEGRGEKGDLNSASSVHSPDFRNFNRGADQRDIIRLLIMAAQNSREPGHQFRGHTWGIPFRPVRRIGSEFLGKRSDMPPYHEFDDEEKRARMGSEFLGKRGMGSEFLGKRGMGSEFLGKRGKGSEFLGKRGMGSVFLGKRGMGSESLGKRGMGSEFLGKRGMGSEFLGKRGMGSEFLGKRGMGSEFLGKRGMGSEFLGKRGMGSEFLGKRGMGSEFLGKRGMGSEFLGKRGMGSEFLGKRGMGSEFLGKRGMGSEFLGKRRMGSEFLGKRDDDNLLEQEFEEELPPQFLYQSYSISPLELDGEMTSPSDIPYNPSVAKRALGSEFLGKRKQGNSYDYSWKRGRLGSEFLGKRSTTPEQPYPYLQTDTDFDLSTTGKLSSDEVKPDLTPAN